MANPDLIDVPVRVLNETDRAWLVTQREFGSRGAVWLRKVDVAIPDLNEIKPHLTARLSRALAEKHGLKGEMS